MCYNQIVTYFVAFETSEISEAKSSEQLKEEITMEEKSSVFLFWGTISVAFLVCLIIFRLFSVFVFEISCKEYINNATKAVDIETAKSELEKAINYMEERDLTHGTVSILFENPKNDIGFWYSSIKNIYEELQTFPKDVFKSDETDFLRSVQEKIQNITVPDGISIYPYNRYFLGAIIISIIVAIICFGLEIKNT